MSVLQGYAVTMDCLYVGGLKTKLLSTSVLIQVAMQLFMFRNIV